MQINPPHEPFAHLYNAGTAQVVWTRLVADLETPVSAYLKLSQGEKMSFLLESVEGGAVRGRYSIIGLAPDLVFRVQGNEAQINQSYATQPDQFEPMAGGTLAALRAVLAQSRIDLPAELPPMAAGVFGYLGYETVRLVENIGAAKPDIFGIPDGLMVRPTVLVIFDAVRDEMVLVTPVRPAPMQDAQAAYNRATDRLTQAIEALDQNRVGTGLSDEVSDPPLPVSNTSEADYLNMVAKAQEYIAAGDIFQVVLGQRFEAPFTLPPFALYRALRRVNPSPYLVFLNFGDFALAGSSPEILVRVRDNEVTIRPIAGTYRRGATEAEDISHGEKLLADPKERAEHLMLLDLGRNDVGRVSKIGTVKVTDSFFLERYSEVMHIVSNVTGQLDTRYDAIDALLAGFPAGTVSGAPKVRAMQIINELERDKRGAYAGCVGYFSANGDMDSCIVLRTALIKEGTLYVQAGAGIVADSVPVSEYQECIAKSRALFRAAEEAVRFATHARRGQ